ncbi:MAG: hypothetical protein MUO26_03500 [Methanotrichaceae archaeon]|nr:hypothetical protein [Methanotrichaceae archaeon]
MLDRTLGFAAGIMVAASYWSLLAPALEMSAGGDVPAWIPAAIGFLTGGLFLRSNRYDHSSSSLGLFDRRIRKDKD